MKKYIKKNSVSNFKRSDTNGMRWEPFQRFTKLHYLKNKHINFFKLRKSLTQVMTFKECEIIYQLPANTCVRDFKSGLMKAAEVRKSYTTYLLTTNEAMRLYENYHTERAHKDERHLYSGFDGKKMSEKEFIIKYGSQYELIE